MAVPAGGARHGAPSFVPPPPIRELRDLTRYRTAQVQERTRETQRLDKVLQDAGIKLSSVASKTLGVSVRLMLEAMIGGTHDPEVLAQLAKGRLRAKLPALREALAGRFRTEHHGLPVGQVLAHIDYLDETAAFLTQRIERVTAPFSAKVALLRTIPGVDRRAACVIIAGPGSRSALLRPGPLRTVHAPHRRTRLKQAPRALRVGVLASCACGLGARVGRRRVASGFGCRPACRTRRGRRGARHLSPGG